MITPNMADNEEDDQFKIASERGYFLTRENGEPYIIKSVSVPFALVDLWNPEARDWVKQVIKENMIEEAGAWGWMHDFGEYTPLDSYSACGKDMWLLHNDYPLEWAKVAEEAINESGVERADQILTFMRAGSTTSPQHTRLFWMGDQLPTFDGQDGMKSALRAMLNGGMSGFTLGHSDIGGYTQITTPLPNGMLEHSRTKENLMRWIEMNAFSDMIMRTHVGSNPAKMFQVWDDEETAVHFAKFVKIHVGLKDYKLELMRAAETTGVPPVRPMMMEFESDRNTWAIDDQFMLGDKILVAPIFQVGATERDVYMPEGRWEHWFTKETLEMSGGSWLRKQSAIIG